jgi:hypothetical protein
MQIIFKNPVITSQKTQRVSITLVKLFKEIIAVFSEHHVTPTYGVNYVGKA